jgi:hypothetical protein
MNTSLHMILVIALVASGLVHVVRALAPDAWKIRKPISCNLCMSFWTSLFVSFLFWAMAGWVTIIPAIFNACVYVLAATSICVMLLKVWEFLDRSGALPPDDLD